MDLYYGAAIMVSSTTGQRVLIVDDDEVSRGVTALVFQVRGWTVGTAGDLRAAVDAAVQQQPHVIVSELLLPDVQSFQFSRALRSAVDHDIQVVALTRAQPEVFEQARRDGFDLVFGKPQGSAPEGDGQRDGLIDEIERHVRRTTRMRKLAR